MDSGLPRCRSGPGMICPKRDANLLLSSLADDGSGVPAGLGANGLLASIGTAHRPADRHMQRAEGVERDHAGDRQSGLAALVRAAASSTPATATGAGTSRVS